MILEDVCDLLLEKIERENPHWICRICGVWMIDYDIEYQTCCADCEDKGHPPLC